MKTQNLICSLILAGGLFLTSVAVSAQETQTEQKTGCEQVTKYTCPMHPEVIQKEPGKCPQCGMDLVKMEHKQMYTCPMHPEVMSDKPGKCPQCGMDLTKAEHHGMYHEKDSAAMKHHHKCDTTHKK